MDVLLLWSSFLTYLVVLACQPPSLFSSFFSVLLKNLFPLTPFGRCLLLMSSLFFFFACMFMFYPFSFFFPLFTLHRLLVRTCVHHQHIPATCYLITRARATLKTSLAEQTWTAKHQSVLSVMQPKPTVIQRELSSAGMGEDAKSYNRGTFYIN